MLGILPMVFALLIFMAGLEQVYARENAWGYLMMLAGLLLGAFALYPALPWLRQIFS